MSWRVTAAVATAVHPTLIRFPRAARFMAALASFADDDGRAHPSLWHMAEKMGLSMKTAGARGEPNGVRDLRRTRDLLLAEGLIAYTGRVVRKTRELQIQLGQLDGSRGAAPLAIKGRGTPVSETPPRGAAPLAIKGRGTPVSETPPRGAAPRRSRGAAPLAIKGCDAPCDPVRDPVRDPVIDQDHPPTPQGGADGASPGGLVARYLGDPTRPQDLQLGAKARAGLEARVAGLLAQGVAAADVWAAWEILRDDPWWREEPGRARCVRLGWLVGDPARVAKRLERATWSKRDDDDDEGDEAYDGPRQPVQREPPPDLGVLAPPAWWLAEQAEKAARGGEGNG